MLQFLICLFGLHDVTESDYPVADEEIKMRRDCLKEVE